MYNLIIFNYLTGTFRILKITNIKHNCYIFLHFVKIINVECIYIICTKYYNLMNIIEFT